MENRYGETALDAGTWQRGKPRRVGRVLSRWPRGGGSNFLLCSYATRLRTVGVYYSPVGVGHRKNEPAPRRGRPTPGGGLFTRLSDGGGRRPGRSSALGRRLGRTAPRLPGAGKQCF